MSVTFPTAVPAYPDTIGGEVLGAAAGGRGLSRVLDDYGLDIAALATKLGTGASVPSSGKVLRSGGAGASAWGPIILSTDVNGILPPANGGTGLSALGSGIATFLGVPSSANLLAAMTTKQGSGSVVFSISPTIITPTLTTPAFTDYTSANHSHANNAGGGVLNGANALTAGSVPPSALVSGAGSSWAWQTWTPTLNNLTLGNGVVTAVYTQVGKTIKGYFKFLLGSTSAVGSNPTFSLPVTAAARHATGNAPVGLIWIEDVGIASYTGMAITSASATAALLFVGAVGGTYAGVASITSTVPLTWGTGDYLVCPFEYEAA